MTGAPPAALTPIPGGGLVGRRAADLALTSRRLQAIATPSGIDGLLVWGSGDAGSVRFTPALPPDAAVQIDPNRVRYGWGTGWLRVTMLPSLPVIVVEGGGDVPVLRVVAPRRPPPGFDRPAELRPLADGWGASSGWAQLVVRAVGGAASPARAGAEAADGRGPGGATRGVVDLRRGGLAVVAAGADAEEAERSAAAVLRDPAAALRVYDEGVAELRGVLQVPDPELQSLFLHGLHAARSAGKALADGSFAGFAAGVGYALPPRTYYRDGYWTLQALLPMWPDEARAQLLLLAREVGADGRAPSGVIVASEAGGRSWRARRAADPALAADHPRDGVWWADHTDAPLFFALLACEVAAWTGDPGLFDVVVDGRAIGARVAAALERAGGLVDAGGLPVKPPHDRDWADNVFRGGYVTYDVALYHGALTRVADAIEAEDAGRAAAYRARAAGLRAAARRHLWSEPDGHFVEFREPSGRAEGHLAIDTMTALRFGLADEFQAARVLAAARARLETRHNSDQPYGDWGVMSVYPPYAPWVRRRGKSLFAYRYHNGADWPVWDGVYAEARMARGLRGWRYPLTRWWRRALDRGRATPFEYASPPYGEGSPSNGWSAMPAAAMLLGGFGLTPAGRPRVPPWGDSEVRWRGPDGRARRATVRAGRLEVERDG